MRALFIGNSFTARNNVPGLIASLAAARGKTFEHTLISAGGASLRRHWNDEKARAEIESARYDWVVLQEQSTLPWKNRERFFDNVRLFAPVVGPRLTLYQTWPRLHSLETSESLLTAYEEIGRDVGGLVVPVGRAWLRYQPLDELYDADGSHPSPAGSFLAAACFCHALTGHLPDSVPSAVRSAVLD